MQVELREASLQNPGVPPASLMSFLRAKPSVAGAVLADFDSRFINPYYQSHLDTNVSSDALTSAAIVAARALHDLAYGGKDKPPLKVQR